MSFQSIRLTEIQEDHLIQLEEDALKVSAKIILLYDFVKNQINTAATLPYWIADVDGCISFQEFKTLEELKLKWSEINSLEDEEDDQGDNEIIPESKIQVRRLSEEEIHALENDNDDSSGSDDSDGDDANQINHDGDNGDNIAYAPHPHCNLVMLADFARNLYMVSHYI